MGVRETNQTSERRRYYKRNLKRYTYTQSFNRLSDKNNSPHCPFSPMSQARCRAGLAIAAAVFFGVGLYFVFF